MRTIGGGGWKKFDITIIRVGRIGVFGEIENSRFLS